MAIIHDYFEPVPYQKGTHTCNLCHKPIKGINPTNLKQHLKIKHVNTYQEFLDKTFNNAPTAKIEEEDTVNSNVISDYYDQEEDGNFQCSLCQAVTSPTHLFQHFKTHKDVYMQYLERRRSIKPLAKPPQKRKTKIEYSGPPKRGKRQYADDDDFSWPVEEEDEANPEFLSVDEINGTTTFQEVQQVPVDLPKDPLELFFKTMYETVKEMPREEIFAIRRKIFETVCDAEERLHSKASGDPAST